MASKFLMNQAIADAQNIDQAPASTNFDWSNMFKGFGNTNQAQDVTYPNKLQNESFSDLSYVDDGTHHPRKTMPIQTRNLNYNIHQNPPRDWRADYQGTYGAPTPDLYSNEPAMMNLKRDGIMATNTAQKKGNFMRNILDNTIMGQFAAMNDATNPRAFNYNPKLEGQIDYMKANNAYGVIDSSGLNKITRGVLKDKNLQSMFGSNDLGQMLSNQLSKYEKTHANMDKQWGKTLNEKELELKKQKYFKKFIEPARIEKENQIAAAKKAADERIAVEKQRAGTAPQRREGKGATHMSRSIDQGGLGIRSDQAQSISDANRAAGMSGWRLAQGGRAGYQGGELVEQETDFIDGPQGGEEFQETVVEGQEQPSREQLEALAIEIFQLPLEELDEQQLLVVYQEAMQGQPMEEAVREEDVQFAAQGGLAGLL